jgi:hypothetical protein
MLRELAESKPERDGERCQEEGDAILSRLPTPPDGARWGVTNLGGGWTITLTLHRRFHGPTPDTALDAALVGFALAGLRPTEEATWSGAKVDSGRRAGIADVDLHPQVQRPDLLIRRRTYQCPGCFSYMSLLPPTDPLGSYECDCGERLTCTDLRGEPDA